MDIAIVIERDGLDRRVVARIDALGVRAALDEEGQPVVLAHAEEAEAWGEYLAQLERNHEAQLEYFWEPL